MRNYLLFASVLLFTMSCNHPKSTDKIFIDLSDKINRSEDLSSEIEKAEFFQIAMTTPIENPCNMHLMNDCIYFVDRGGSTRMRINGLIAIDLKGNVLWKNDKKGKGPGEYLNIFDLTVLPGSEQIVINDNWSQKLIVLNKDGNYFNQVDYTLNSHNMVEVNPGTLVVNLSKGFDMSHPEQTLNYDLAYMDLKGNISKKVLPNKHTGKGWFSYGDSQTLVPGEKELLYTNTLDYSIYLVTPEGATPKWTLDFGRFNADTAKYLYAKTWDEGPGNVASSGKCEEVLSFKVNHSAKNLWILVPHGKKLNLEIINKKTHEVSHYVKPEKTEFLFHGIPVPVYNLIQNGDRILYSLSAITARENWDALSTEQKTNADPKWRKLMENLDPEGNPIVVMLSLR
jgi:hypothetical protein